MAENRIECLSNNYRISLRNGMRVALYSVAITPRETETTIQEAILSRNERAICASLGCVAIAVSGMTLAVIETVGATAVVNTAVTCMLRKPDSTEASYEVNLVRKLEENVAGDDGQQEKASLVQISLLNKVIKRAMCKMHMNAIKGKYYYHHQNPEEARKSLVDVHTEVRGMKLHLIRNYYTTTLKISGSLYLQVDMSHRLLRGETVADWMDGGRGFGQDGFKALSQDQKDSLEKEMIGTAVLTPHNNRVYRIDCLDWEMSINSTFTLCATKEEITIRGYFQTVHGIALVRDDLPMILYEQKSKGKVTRKLFLPPEVCQPTGLTDEIRGCQRVMRALADTTIIKPDKRIGLAKKVVEDIMDPESEAFKYLAKCGVEVSSMELALVGNRQPQGIFIPYTDVSESTRTMLLEGGHLDEKQFAARVDDSGQFSRDALKGKLFDTETVDFTNWCVVHQVPEWTDSKQFGESTLGHGLRVAAKAAGVTLKKPALVNYRINRGNASQVVRDVEGQLRDIRPTFVLFVLGKEKASAAFYLEMKKLLSIKVGIPSQGIKQESINNPRFESFLDKIFLQMCVKHGAVGWTLNTNDSIPTVVLGVTVRKAKDYVITCFSASYDTLLSKFYTRSYLEKLTEVHDAVGASNVTNFMEDFISYARAERLMSAPRRFIIYRQSEGPSQEKGLLSDELPFFLRRIEAMQAAADGETPAWCYMTVSKESHMRFMTSAANKDNPPPGTSFTKNISADDEDTFYMVHQKVIAGTVNPTKYTVLGASNDFHTAPNGKSLQSLITLTSQLACMYQNWSGPVRVPSPLMYACKAARQQAEVLDQEPSQRLDGKLHFL